MSSLQPVPLHRNAALMQRVRKVAATAALVVVPGGAVVGAYFALRWLQKLSPTNTGLLNVPPPWRWAQLYRTSKAVDLMAPVARPTSIYRTKRVNAAVGGVQDDPHTPKDESSDHTKARAVDFVPLREGGRGYTMAEVYEHAMELYRRGVFENVINEGDHVHTEVNPAWRPS